MTHWFHFFQSFRSFKSFLISTFLFLQEAPLKSENMLRCSQGVNKGNRILCYGHTPIIFRSFPGFQNTSTPITFAIPFDFLSIPERQLIVVVFPAPLWPNKAKIYPAYMLIERFSIATNFPKTFQRPLTSKNLFSSSSHIKVSGTF